MKKFIALIFLLYTIFAHAEVPYAWPLDCAVRFSASFAELRANHFHSGIDLSTSGAVGVKVFAAEDGFVSRVKVSPYGYGYALYIDHPDGNTSVYAHLSQYAPKIAALVRAEQNRRMSYEIDWFPEPNAIKIKRGEVVALSGNSGSSGGPHLHFEVRDTKSEEPMNPLSFLPQQTDNQSPTIYGVKLYALSDDAHVGGKTERYFALNDIAGRTIEVLGEVGCGVHAVDYFTAGGRPCGVVEIALYDADELIFRSRLDRFSFDDTRYVNAHIDYAERAQNQRFIQKSFVEPNNNLKIYTERKSLKISPNETHQMRYELVDFAGNRSSVRFTLFGKATTSVPVKTTPNALWDSTFRLDTLGAYVLIEPGALYKNERIEMFVEYSQRFAQNIFTIGSERIALHRQMKIRLPLPERFRGVEHVFVAQIGKNDKLSYVKSRLEGDSAIVAETKSMGRFAVVADTIAPKVVSRNSRTNLNASNFVMVGVSDDLSGIAHYDCFVDGQWKGFEFDYKNSMLKAKIGDLDLAAGRHELIAVVADECGNQAEMKWIFNVIE